MFSNSIDSMAETSVWVGVILFSTIISPSFRLIETTVRAFFPTSLWNPSNSLSVSVVFFIFIVSNESPANNYKSVRLGKGGRRDAVLTMTKNRCHFFPFVSWWNRRTASTGKWPIRLARRRPTFAASKTTSVQLA